jgi:hypothetical protein
LSLKLRRSTTEEAASFTFDISNDADLSNAVPIAGFAFGMLYIPSNFDGTQIKFHTSDEIDGTFTEVIDPTTGSDITYTVAASKSCPVAPEVFGARWLKIESVTDQATDDTVVTATFSS